MFTIFVSACVALYETINRLIHPQNLTQLWALAGAGVIGFVGNEIAAQVRLRGRRRLRSPGADRGTGARARVNGLVSLGVVASAVLVAFGFPRADPIIGLVITVVILEVAMRIPGRNDPGSNK